MLSRPLDNDREKFPVLVSRGILLAGFALLLALNWPGQMSYDSVVQLADGRSGQYDSWHPPVMAWLLGLFDSLLPGTGLYLVFTGFLLLGGWFVLMRQGRPGLGTALLLLLIFATPAAGAVPGHHLERCAVCRCRHRRVCLSGRFRCLLAESSYASDLCDPCRHAFEPGGAWRGRTGFCFCRSPRFAWAWSPPESNPAARAGAMAWGCWRQAWRWRRWANFALELSEATTAKGAADADCAWPRLYDLVGAVAAGSRPSGSVAGTESAPAGCRHPQGWRARSIRRIWWTRWRIRPTLTHAIMTRPPGADFRAMARSGP